jgi:hypothetical protein
VPQPRKAAHRARAIALSSIPGARKSALPRFIPPQLATLVDAAPGGDDWLHEVKLDGYRLLEWGGVAREFRGRTPGWHASQSGAHWLGEAPARLVEAKPSSRSSVVSWSD